MESDDDGDDMASPQPQQSTSKTPNNSPEEEFILSLETMPELWDKKCNDYTNKYKRRIGYEKLQKILVKIKPRTTVEDVKKKINSLRSNYRRELKKIVTSKRSGAGTGEVYVPKSWTFKYLTFLQNAEKPVSEISHTEDSDDPSMIQQPNDTQEESWQVSSQENSSSLSSINVMPAPAQVNEGSNAKKKKITIARTQHELLKKACTYLSQPEKACSSAALVWSEKLEQMDPIQKLYAEKAINDILFEGQLGNLNRFSVKINQSVSEDILPSSNSSSPAYIHRSSSARHAPSPRENIYTYTPSLLAAERSSAPANIPSPRENCSNYTASPSPPSAPSSLRKSSERSSSATHTPSPRENVYTYAPSPLAAPSSLGQYSEHSSSQAQNVLHPIASNIIINNPASMPPPSFASSTPLVIQVNTDSLNEQDSYNLHIPSTIDATPQIPPSDATSQFTYSEYNVGTLFAEFKADL
ncbi:uncharacterized protein LOC106134444 [Amyelois transitella]|uniref:uncharacterized protein LOC106134444 n=1 Tax=Amyelois transitella TaxID=680683 RepID=UPI00298FFC19|nr:uncharacterized protein LOC106134444 [Amyelois transitella]